MTLTISSLAAALGGTVHLPSSDLTADAPVSGIAAVDKATAAQVTFLINPEYMKFAATTAAAAVITAKIVADCLRPQIIHKNPYWAFAKTSQMFVEPRKETGAISPQAFVSPAARIGRNVTIYPFAYVSEDVEIGDGVVVFPGSFLGRGVRVGKDSIIRANAVIEDGCIIGERALVHANATIGSDGFGFAPGDHDIAKIPQVGIVRIHDDVEIGASSTVDRAAMGETVIGRGTKLDSGAHVAHNVRIGENTLFCGHAAAAGSAKIGNWVTLGGRVSINNHVEIGDRVTIGALAGVTKSIKEPGEYIGFPAVPVSEWRREIAAVRRLKQLTERVRKLEELLSKMDQA